MHSKQLVILFLLTTLSFFACKKVDIQFGQELVDNDYTQIIKLDTFAVDLSTVYVDSFVTSAKGVTLLGGYTDTTFGRIDTKSYFELDPPTYQAKYDSTRFDSLNLIVKLNKNYYGDTTQPLHLDVKRLSQQIVYPQEGVSSFYNKQTFSVFDPPLGSKDLLVYPTFRTDTISIRLTDALGKELLSKLQNRADQDIQNSLSFINYFNGLRISSNASSNVIINCDDNIIMRLFYNRKGIDSVEKYHTDFTVTNKQHHFNDITVDRSNLKTALKTIGASNRSLNSKQLNNLAYSQYASGVMTKLTFPSLGDVLKIPNYKKVLRAILKVVPVRGSFAGNYFLPPSLSLASTDLNNGIGSPLATYSNSGSLVAQTGNLFLDNVYGDNTTYTYDLSSFVTQYLKNPTNNTLGLLLVPPSPALQTQFSRVIIGSQNHPTSKTILELYYVTVK